MAKRLFLLLIFSLIGVASAPDILMATDSFLIREPDFNAVETVEIVEEPEVVEAPAVVQNVVETPRAVVTASYSAPVVTVQNYNVTTYVGSAKEFNEIANSLSYGQIYKFRKMVYGHNTYNLLGSLSSRYVGETITVTEGGVAKSYRVAAVVVYQKTADGNLEGNPQLMKDIANTAMGHDIALLTCYGTSYGNGDASHRLVVYADAI